MLIQQIGGSDTQQEVRTANHRSGSGRQVELLLRAGRGWRCPAGTDGEHGAEGYERCFGSMPRCRIALETGTHSPWVSRLLSELGHEAMVAHARSVRLSGKRTVQTSGLPSLVGECISDLPLI